MAHSLILGMTESGKTTLATNIAHQFKDANYSTIVLDEMRDPRWNADFITDDEEEFLHMFYNSRNCAVFIDEARDVDFTNAMEKTATRGRHWGHAVHYIGQREVGIPRTVRAQCKYLFMFALPYDDRMALAKDFNSPVLKTDGILKQGEFIKTDKFGHYSKHEVKFK